MKQFEEITVEAAIEKIQNLNLPEGSKIRIVIEMEEIDEQSTFSNSESRQNALDGLFGIWDGRNINASDLRKKAWERVS